MPAAEPPNLPAASAEALASFVRQRRKANHMTQRHLAELAGVGIRFVSELERAKPTVRLGTVNAVLAVFGKQLGIVDRARSASDAAVGGASNG